MRSVLALSAETITEPGAKSFIELKVGLKTEPGVGLAIELEARLAVELRAQLVTEPGTRLADTKKLLIPIIFITIINVNTSRLHDLIRTYSDKKQTNHHSKPLQILTTVYCSTSTNTNHQVLYAKALKALLLSILSTKVIYKKLI